MADAELWDSRSRTLIGDEALARLGNSKVIIAGLGGVGGYVAEILTRSGVGNLVIIDADVVAMSNINRQIIADHNTIGRPKTELWRHRLLNINPEIKIEARQEFLTPENIPSLLDDAPDFVADAIDTVAPKMALITTALEYNIPIISSMGAGGRIDASQVSYGTLADTRSDGLARTIRQRMRKQGINPSRLDVVWSSELPERRAVIDLEERNKRSSFGTLATVPALFGIFMANFIIRKIAGI